MVQDSLVAPIQGEESCCSLPAKSFAAQHLRPLASAFGLGSWAHLLHLLIIKKYSVVLQLGNESVLCHGARSVAEWQFPKAPEHFVMNVIVHFGMSIVGNEGIRSVPSVHCLFAAQESVSCLAFRMHCYAYPVVWWFYSRLDRSQRPPPTVCSAIYWVGPELMLGAVQTDAFLATLLFDLTLKSGCLFCPMILSPTLTMLSMEREKKMD